MIMQTLLKNLFNAMLFLKVIGIDARLSIMDYA